MEQIDTMIIENWPLSRLREYERNPRKNDHAVEKLAAAIKEFGFRIPVIARSNGEVVDGHLRIKAARFLGLDEVPVVLADDLTPAQVKAFRISVNRMAELADWDEDLLRLELEDLQIMDVDLELTGLDDEYLQDLLQGLEPTEGLTDEDAVPDVPEQAVTVKGDLWLMGHHRLLCGDSTDVKSVERLMGGEKAQLLHADPPYGMGKEKDGVLNDNLYREKLDNFQTSWWNAGRIFLEDNASVYVWGNAEDLWRWWYSALQKMERLTLRNEIVWNKNSAQGMSSEGFRMYPPESERCLFFMLGEQGFNNNADNYFEGWEPVRDYLLQSRLAMGWDVPTMKKIVGHSDLSRDHWTSKSQFEFPTCKVYEKMKAEADRVRRETKNDAFKKEYDELKKEYDELKKEYDELKKEFYQTRAYFDNTHDNMTDVWQFDSVRGGDRHGHATPKPVVMMVRVIKSSSPESSIVYDPFLGSGTTLIACEKTGRRCYGMELAEHYCDVIINRWQDFTGREATLADDGRTFAEVKAARK